MIDFHAHAFADALAPRALANLSQASGGLAPRTDGTLSGAAALFQAAGVEWGVIANIATKPSHQHTVNEWAARHNERPFVQFGSVHPDAPDALEELEYIAASGLKGVKFHPEYQRFYVDEPRMKPIYRKLASLGLIALFHAGWDIGLPPPCHCAPEMLARALPWFDGAPVVAAHLGGWQMAERVVSHLCGLPLYFDTAYCAAHVPVWQVRMLLDRHGVQRILLGSDLPWSHPLEEARLLQTILGQGADYRAVTDGNARRLLGL